VLAYAFSTVIWLPVLLGKNRSFAFTAAGTFGPTLAVLVSPKIASGRWSFARWWSTLPRFVLGLLAGGSLYLFADFLTAAIITKSGFDRWHWAALTEIVTLFPMNLLGGPLGEEAGWRGFALARIQQRMSPSLAAIVIGIFWAGWHYPLILAHIYSVNWWQFLLLTVSSSIIISFGFNIGGGSTVCAIVLHGIYNVALGVIGNDVIGKAQLRSQSFQMHALWVCYVAVAMLLCIVTGGHLGYRGTASESFEVRG
jgi:CAAX protease family protein